MKKFILGHLLSTRYLKQKLKEESTPDLKAYIFHYFSLVSASKFHVTLNIT